MPPHDMMLLNRPLCLLKKFFALCVECFLRSLGAIVFFFYIGRDPACLALGKNKILAVDTDEKVRIVICKSLGDGQIDVAFVCV